MDDTFAQLYEAEKRWKTIIYSTAGISIFIACLGLLGMASLSIVNRSKEVGIRKVFGASNFKVVYLLVKDFLKPVFAAFLFAIPITYVIMNNWLQNFAYRIDMGISPFIISFLVVFFATFLTISYQTLKTATANPVDSINME